jgi:PIN domain nuclease of toxin-antitoxin system
MGNQNSFKCFIAVPGSKKHHIYFFPISFFEIAQKVRLGKWPEMEPFVATLPALLVEQGGYAARLDPTICNMAGLMDWAHRDPFDRIVAATAMNMKLTLVSADVAFDGVVARVW